MVKNSCMQNDRIFVFGASGHAKVIIDIIERQQLYDIAYIVDDNPDLKGENIYGYSVIGGKAELLAVRDRLAKGIVAIGNNEARTKVAAWLRDNNFEIITAIHPTAQLARGVLVGAGTAIMAGAIINSDSVVGENVIINTGATVDHDCTIGNSVHIAPGSTLCGTVQIGDGSFIGAGTKIIPNLTIGNNVTVGAGATVVKNLPNDVTAIGTPARIVSR
jgi:sugar O-acyltransferase (sialic acid O-acetyltransferase NeuD family)